MLDRATAARLLRAKEGEHESYLQWLPTEEWGEVDYLRADIALLAGMLAGIMEGD
jgi:hypothetical protein